MQESEIMAMTEISLNHTDENILKAVKDNWLLVTAGNEENCSAVTGSGYSMGAMPGQDVSTVFVRHPKDELQLLESEEFYSVSFFNSSKPSFSSVIGTDAIAEAGLELAMHNNVPYFEDAEVVFICKKLYADNLTPDKFTDADDDTETGEDLPRMYMGSIVAVLKNNTADIDDPDDFELPAMPEAGATKPKKKLNTKTIGIGLAGAAVVLYIASRFLGGGGETTPTYETVAAHYADLTQTLSASGRVATAESDTIFLPADVGALTVTSVNATVGELVTEGQVLATFDTRDLANNVNTANTAYRATVLSNQDAFSNADSYNAALNEVNRLKSEQNTLPAELTNLTTEEATNNARITALNTPGTGIIDTLTTNIGVLTSQIATSTTDISVFESRIAIMMSADPTDPLIPATQILLDAERINLANLQQQEATLQAQLNAANQELTTLTQRNAWITQRQADINAYIPQLPALITAAEANVATLRPYYLTQAQRMQMANNENTALIQLQKAQRALTAARRGIVAPRDGILIYLGAQEGGTATGGMQVAIVGDMGELEIAVPLSKYEIEDVQIGQLATIRVGNNNYTGYVDRVDNATTTTLAGSAAAAASPSNYVNAYIHINVNGHEIPLGFEANVEITLNEKTNVLVVPITAVITDIDGTYCLVVTADGTTEQRPVVTGISDNTMTEIISGLKEGDAVVANPGLIGATQLPAFFIG